MPLNPSAATGPRTRQRIEQLHLIPHPEGGWYREVFRSSEQVTPTDGRPARAALTSIYFLLASGQHSRWHKVLSDEVWVHLEGAALDLWTWRADDQPAVHTVMGPLGRDIDEVSFTQPQCVVPAGLWQAAQPRLEPDQPHTLVACMVGPGFDFADFQMMQPDGPEVRLIRHSQPQLAPWI